MLGVCAPGYALDGGGVIVGPAPVPAGGEAKDPKDDKPKEDKPKGPEHNVTLIEEPGVVDLLTRAQKARARAEKDPQVWPECVKYYADILKKYPNTVYLDRWEGPDKKEMAFKNGLYKSTRERVARDIASLPPAGLESYRLINDPVAKSLFFEGQEQFNETRMVQVAQDYFSTTLGDDALVWLAEVAYNRGAPRQAISRLNQVARHPNADVSKTGLLVRTLLAQAQAGDKAGAEKTLKALTDAAGDPGAVIRAGHAEGPAAIEKLRARVENIVASGTTPTRKVDSARSWETYFGNAAHNRTPPARKSVGVLKWSVPIVQLLYGPNAEVKKDQEAVDPNTGGNVIVPETQNQHVTVQEGLFYICDWNVVAAYPIGNPKPGPASAGNAKFLWPGEIESPKAVRTNVRFRRNMGFASVRHHPYFTTVGGERLFAACGAEPMSADPNIAMWGGQEQKQRPNFLVAVGATSGKLLWSLKDDSAAFQAQSKPDQEWLKSIFFVSAPTYDAGVLYAMAVSSGGSADAWVAAIDAENGQILWRTQICSASPVMMTGPVQPDLGLPVAVANGIVFVNTNIGAVATLDAASGTVRWIRVYDRVANKVDRFNVWDARGQVSSFFGPNPPIVHENIVIVTPQDSNILYAYDIETGKRAWQVDRSVDGGEGGGLKHILGITNNHLVLTGTNIHFYELKSGKKAGPAEAFPLESPIKGRGTVTEDMVFVSTEKALVRLDVGLVEGRLAVKIRDTYKWTEPANEAGNITLAGDVLYTTTQTHVNAFFVWEEMETKLRDKIKAQPNDMASYIELIDVYQRVELYDKALSTVEEALAACEKGKADPKVAASLIPLQVKKFDALKALADGARAQKVPDVNSAYENYKKALAVARLEGLPQDLPVIALHGMAEMALAKNEPATAVDHFQEIIARHGDAAYTMQRSAAKARLFAQAQIEDIKRKEPKSYDKIAEQARAAFQAAGNDVQKLEALLSLYPNADVFGSAVLRLAQLSLEATPDQSRNFSQRYLRISGAPETPQATAYLAIAYERLKMLTQSRDMLRRLATRKEFKDKTIAVDPLAPKAPAAAPINVVEWATKRLTDPMYQRAISNAQWSLGAGKLKPSWTRPAANTSIPINVQGVCPASMRGSTIYIENNSELMALAASEKGEELWTPRPRIPSASGPRAIWAENLLVMWGDKEIVAFDSSRKGEVMWKKTHIAAGPPQSIQVVEQRLVAAYPTGTLCVLDSATGAELWRTQVEGNFGSIPACGEGFVAVVTAAPTKLIIYDVETGGIRDACPIDGNVTVPPLASGDRVYFADKNNKLFCRDGLTGKLQWEHGLDAAITSVRATRELVFVCVNQKEIRALSTDPAAEKREIWRPQLPPGSVVHNFQADGDDLYAYVFSQGGGSKASVVSYSIPKQGKFQWPVDVSTEQGSTIALADGFMASGHLIVTQSNWDPTGTKPSAVVLVDRKNGKLTWDVSLGSEGRVGNAPDGTPLPSFIVQMFDGGIVLTEGRKRSAFIASDGAAKDVDVPALLKKLDENPKDADARIRAASALFEKGERDKALETLLTGLSAADDKFSPLYEELARMRREHALKTKQTITFTKLAKAPAMDGNLADWAGVPETVFDTWRNVFLASEDDPKPGNRKPLWKGSTDLKVSFRAACDDKNLHLLFIVTDDVQKNDQTEGGHSDLGDSVKVAFDIERDGGMGWRGEDYLLGLSINKNGKTSGWRWVERSKYLQGDSPLASPVFAARKEAEKQTIYQFAIPMEYLKLVPEAGRKFGISFVINDQDAAKDVEKSIGPTPGLLRPPYPGMFAEGVLGK